MLMLWFSGLSAIKRGRLNLGFPENAILNGWLDSDVAASFPEAEILKVPSIKNPEIPKLNCYRSDPEDSFWSIFPSKSLPNEPETMIDIEIWR